MRVVIQYAGVLSTPPHVSPCFLSSVLVEFCSMVISHRSLTCHGILASYRVPVGLPSFYRNGGCTREVQINAWFFLRKTKRKSQKRKNEGYGQAPQGTQTARSIAKMPHLLSNQGNANQPNTGNLVAVSSHRLWPLGWWTLLPLSLCWLFPEPDDGGFRSISLKTPELQVLHMIWEKILESGWSIKPTPSKHKEKVRGEEPSLVVQLVLEATVYSRQAPRLRHNCLLCVYVCLFIFYLLITSMKARASWGHSLNSLYCIVHRRNQVFWCWKSAWASGLETWLSS